MDEKKESKIELTIEKFKAIPVRTKLFSVSLVLVIALIAILTISDLIIDPTMFADPEKRNLWISKSLILISLTIFGMLFGEAVARDNLMRKAEGLYQLNLRNYKTAREEALPLYDSFDDWFQDFKDEELRSKKIDFLIAHNVKDAKVIVDNIDDIALDKLADSSVRLSNGAIIRRKTQEQCESIQKVIDGEVKIVTYPSNYYFSQYDEGMNAYMSEAGVRLSRKQLENKIGGRLIKLASALITTTILSMITVKEFAAGDYTRWFNLVLRLFSIAGAIITGWNTSATDVKLEAYKVDNKKMVLGRFLGDVRSLKFRPKTYEEKAQEENINDEFKEIDE